MSPLRYSQTYVKDKLSLCCFLGISFYLFIRLHSYNWGILREENKQ